MNVYKFHCYDSTHDTHKWGIEYSTDEDGDNIIDVEWFATEQERNSAMERETA